MPRFTARRGRRGSYSPMMGILIFIIVGFGALSVDVSLMTVANLQAQATADAAAHAALIGFNQNKSVAEAWSSASFVVARNRVALGNATLDAVEIGEWTFDAAVPTFQYPIADIVTANAARARVSRKGGNAVPTLLGGLLGVPTFEVEGEAIAAQRQRAIMLALDLSCSMMDGNGSSTTSPVALLREGTQLFYDYIKARPQSGDMIGIATYAQYASEDPLSYGVPWRTQCTPSTPNACNKPWLPLTEMSDPAVQDRIDGICDTATDENGICPATGAIKADAEDIGTCTSPHHALLQAIEELLTSSTDRYYRAILFMTDGLPNCNPTNAADEARSVAAYAATHNIVIYGVTVTNGFGSDPNFVNDVVNLSAEGGFNQQASDASALPVMFEEVARRLPTVFTD